MRFVAGRTVSDLPEVATPGSEIALLERRKVPASARRQRKADCAKWRSGPLLGLPKGLEGAAMEYSDARMRGRENDDACLRFG